MSRSDKSSTKRRLKAPEAWRSRDRRYKRGILTYHASGPFALDARAARNEHGWTNAECWELVDFAERIQARAVKRLKKGRAR